MDNNNHQGLLVNLCSIILLFITLSSCLPSYEDIGGLTTVVEGRVVDFYTNEGITNVMIVIEDYDSEAAPWEYSHTYYDTIYTDSVGYYRYEFLNEIGRDYHFKPQPTASYFNEYSSRFIFEGKVNTYSPKYKPYRLLSLHVVNKLKKWPRLFYTNHLGKFTIPLYGQCNGLDVDSIILMKFVPDEDIELSFTKSNGYAGQGYEYITEGFTLNINQQNKDTTICLEY